MKKSKILSLLLTIALFGGVFHFFTTQTEANEFEGNEAYWTETCSNYQSAKNMVERCNQYRAHLANLKNQKLSESANAQGKIDSMKGDIDALSKLSYEYATKVEAANNEVESMSAAISKMESSIGEVELKIEKQSAVIDVRKEKIKNRMLHIQGSINTNQFVNFIMGSEDLVDFIQRTKSIKMLTDYDTEQITMLNDDIAILQNDKAEKERIMDTQKSQQAILEQKQGEAEQLQKENNAVFTALKTQSNALATERDNASEEATQIAGLMPSVPAPPVTVIPGLPGGGGNQSSPNANFYGPFYNAPFNIFAAYGYMGQCTWYVYGRANEVNGGGYTNLPTGNAASWVSNAAAKGFQTGTQPRGNSIMVWGNGYYGHVAYVESYQDGIITVSEGNVNHPGGGLPMNPGMEESIRYTLKSTLSYAAYVGQRGYPIGFIYL